MLRPARTYIVQAQHLAYFGFFAVNLNDSTFIQHIIVFSLLRLIYKFMHTESNEFLGFINDIKEFIWVLLLI